MALPAASVVALAAATGASNGQGVALLLHGTSGTGKTLAAEALGYDLGCPLKVVNSSALISKWVGESAKNIEAVFDDAAAAGALLVFDEAEGLFAQRTSDGGSTSRHDSMNVGILLHHMMVGAPPFNHDTTDGTISIEHPGRRV